MEPPVSPPFDSAFWSLVVAALALCVSIAPWVWRAIRPVRLRMEISDVVFPMHFPSGSVLGVFLSLSNIGTRPLRVSQLIGRIEGEDGKSVETSCAVFFPKPEDLVGVTFLPVFLKPGESWGGFFTNFTHRLRENWKKARQNEEQIQAHPQPYFGAPYPVDLEARNGAIAKQRDLFFKTLSWQPISYKVTFTAVIEGAKSPVSASYVFMLHDSEMEEITQAASNIGVVPTPLKNWPAVTMTATGQQSKK